MKMEVNAAGMAILKWSIWAQGTCELLEWRASSCLVELREELIANQASESWE